MTGAVDIQALHPKNRPYKVGLGKGLFLLVMPNGSKYWRFKYRIQRKEGILALGTFPAVSFEQALHARDLARQQVEDGIKPHRVTPEKKIRDTAYKTTAQFLLSVSLTGEVTIKASGKTVVLDRPQTRALKAFLHMSCQTKSKSSPKAPNTMTTRHRFPAMHQQIFDVNS